MQPKETIIEYLNSFDSNKFRKIKDTADEAYIHEEQLEAAKNVIAELDSNVLRTNHVILVAKMQSGKTGTCAAIANMIMETEIRKDMGVNKILFITGMNDCGLASQTYERTLQQIIQASDKNTYDGTKTTKDIKRPKFYILKNSNLKKFNRNINGSLIFIDEAHFGSKEKNVLTKFMSSQGIDWKNKNDLITNNIYIVSVSATPFEEIVSDTLECKPMVELKTTNSYIGVSEYLNKGLIHDATKDDIENGLLFDYIEDAYNRMKENHEKGVVIVRTRKFDKIKNNDYIKKKFDIHEMYANGSKVEYDKFNAVLDEMVKKNAYNNRLYYRSRRDSRVTAQEQEFKPRLVLIKGAFRAGITIPSLAKDIIYMIYDYSLEANATAQALLGRMCGYRNLQHAVFNTHFYLNSRFAKMYSEWENDFTNKTLVPSSRTKWVWMDNTYNGNDIKLGTKPSGNIAINLTNEDAKYIWQTCAHARSQREATMHIIPQILRKYNQNIDYDYFIEAYMSGKNTYAKSVQIKRFDSFSPTSLVFQFEPKRIKEFKEQHQREEIRKEDIGKKAIGVVFDATVEFINGRFVIGGNRRLLIYRVEVGQKKKVANHQTQYQAHKDTALI